MIGNAWHRRRILQALALAPFAGRAWASQTDAFPDHVTLLIAGPSGGGLDEVGRTLASKLQQHMPAGTAVAALSIGGVDGVTGANQFATQTGLDGGTAMLVPGAAVLAWLAGDSRVHFDPSRWLPIIARTAPAIASGHAEAELRLRGGIIARTAPAIVVGHAIRPGRRVRVAAGSAISPALAAMLAFDLLGAEVQPVFGLGDPATALSALQAGHVEAVLLHGSAPLESLAADYPAAQPQFSFGVPTGDGAYRRDDAAPEIPTLLEYNTALGRPAPAGPRFEAWCCAAGAVQLQYALVLPSLTPPSGVALWHEAGAHALAPDSDGAILYASAASVLLRSLNPRGATLLDLRGWLADRLGWQPG
jgi:tripartite-type tricarboxylate transporter receptor subunit TctC